MTLEELRKRLSDVDRELIGLVAARQRIVAEIGALKIRNAVPTRDYEREREVLGLLAEGLSNQQIAERLVITPATVKFHTRSIRSKLGTSSRTETVVVALNYHLVPAAPA